MKATTRSKLITTAVIVLIIASLALFSCQQKDQKQELDKVNIRLYWLHQAQFAGFYTAEQKGFYKENKIDVTINPGGLDFPSIQMVAGGTEQFGVTGADQILLAREKGVPVVALATIYRKSPIIMFSIKDSNITKPQDFIGKNIAVQPGTTGEVIYKAVMKNIGIDTSKYTEVTVKYDITPLLTGQVDVWSSGYAINEPILAQEKGFDVNIIWPSDYNVTFYADTLFTTEDMIKNNPELVRRFVKATIKGWSYAYDNPQEAVNHTLKYSDQLNKEHESKMMQASLGLIKPDNNPIGYTDKKVLEDMQKLLIESGQMKSPVDIDKAYTEQFL